MKVLRRRAALASLSLLACALFGCVSYFEDRRAVPGRVDLATPPPKLANERLDPPHDPGERARSLRVSLLGGGGARFPQRGADQASRALYALALQLGMRFGESESVRQRLMGPLPLVLPDATDTSWGWNVGWTFLQAGSLATSGGALYAEVDRAWLRGFFRAGGGYAVSFFERAHGPQATLGLGPFFLRVRHLFGAATDVAAGVDVSFLFTWLRTR